MEYYYGIEAAMRAYPEGGRKGDCFVNGETCSIWVWDPFLQRWCNTVRDRFDDLRIIDAPESYLPRILQGETAQFGYLSHVAGTIVFPYFIQEEAPIWVTLTAPSWVWLTWNGFTWQIKTSQVVGE